MDKLTLIFMKPSQEDSRERSQRAIDAEIKALEISTGIRALRLRRNALSPISTLPPEVLTAIFSLLCPQSSDENPDHHRARLHVCHLRITADNFRLRRTLEGLVLPAPTFECLVVVSTGDSAVKR